MQIGIHTNGQDHSINRRNTQTTNNVLPGLEECKSVSTPMDKTIRLTEETPKHKTIRLTEETPKLQTTV